MTACEVIVWKDGTFQHSKVFVGDERGPSVAPKAEAYFKQQVRELVQFSVVEADLENAIEDGYFYDSESDVEVIITWPLVEEVK